MRDPASEHRDRPSASTGLAAPWLALVAAGAWAVGFFSSQGSRPHLQILSAFAVAVVAASLGFALGIMGLRSRTTTTAQRIVIVAGVGSSVVVALATVSYLLLVVP
jgi:hypothetical protein